MNRFHDQLETVFGQHIDVAQATASDLLDTIEELATSLAQSIDAGNKLLTFGNGGSAADAQHFAAELVGRFQRSRRALPAVALSTDSSTLTAIANDFSYDDVFARQVEALCQPGDIVVGISTSGSAANVIRGIEAARQRGGVTWALTGGGGGRLAVVAEHAIVVPSGNTARIQEMHVTIIHAIAEVLDASTARE